MPDPRTSYLRRASLIALCMLMASCGRAGPDGPATAGSPAASADHDGGNTPASSDPSDATAPAKAGSTLGAVQDGDSADDDGSDWPAPRQIPAGTLTWTVVYKGNGTTQNREAKEVAILQRQMHGTAHMVGAMGNAGDTPTSAPLEGMNKAMEACGDDMACAQRAAMAMVGRDPGALERSVSNAMAEAQRDTLWGADACDITGQADDKSTWSGMTPLGFNTGHGTRAGKQEVEGCGEGDPPGLVADDNTHTYKLTIPQARIRVPATFDGKREASLGRFVMFPALAVEGVRYSRLDRPLTGSATLHTGSGIGLYSEGWSVPLSEEVRWTFTPDPN